MVIINTIIDTDTDTTTNLHPIMSLDDTDTDTPLCCADCGDTEEDGTIYDCYHDTLCIDCVENNNLHYCERCDDLHHDDDHMECPLTGEDMCMECWDEWIEDMWDELDAEERYDIINNVRYNEWRYTYNESMVRLLSNSETII